MSRTKKWIAAWMLGIASVGATLGMQPNSASANDARLVVNPAVAQTGTATVQTVGWRTGYYGGSYRGPRVVVAPRVVGPRVVVAPRLGYYGGYRPYRAGYVNRGYGYGYGPYGAYRY